MGEPVGLHFVTDVLSDLLQHSLRLVLCGTAAGTTSAAERAYYAHPQNKFWKILHETRLTPEQLQPRQYRSLLQHGIGLTDLVKVAAGMDRATLPRLSIADRARLDRNSLAARATMASSEKPSAIRACGFCHRRQARPMEAGGRKYGTSLRNR